LSAATAVHQPSPFKISAERRWPSGREWCHGG
jgi:hypothetical protein